MGSGWSLGGCFVEVRLRSTFTEPADRQPYEAIYFIGFDEQDERYMMHLLDTFGARSSRVLGVGEPQGNRTPFLFEYPDGPFTNAFTWRPDAAEWTCHLTFLEGSSERAFAAKRMRGHSKRPFVTDDLAPLPGDRQRMPRERVPRRQCKAAMVG
jgi:hypothetical protein